MNDVDDSWIEDPRPFDRLTGERLNLVRRWVQAMPASPLKLVGDSASRVAEGEPPEYILEEPRLDSWLVEELRALEAVANARVEANLEKDGPGETVDFRFECQSDREAMIAQVVLVLIPRDESIGKIVMMFRVMKLDDIRYAIWPSGLRHV